MIPSRKDVRKGVADLLRANVTAAQVIYHYQEGDFGGASPVVRVTSAGSSRPRLTLRGQKTFFFLGIEVFVLYRDENNPSAWTPENAEDALDDVEQQVSQILIGSHNTPLWNDITFEARSMIDTIVLGGVTYVYEVIPIQVEVF